MSTPVNVTSILFQDAMDSTRFLKIVEEKNDTVVCRVFFGPNKNNLTFVGKVELRKRLFFPTGGTRVGFNPSIESANLVATVKRERFPRERRDQNEYV